ncbi:MAG: ribonuclease R [Eggerthellaceae bacterium]|nr:ribonuclease R [Eggerthellaceae bacterium]
MPSKPYRSKNRPKPFGVLRVPRLARFGFVETPEGEFFISSSDMDFAFPGDLVEVVYSNNRNTKTKQGRHGSIPGKVSRVLERRCTHLIGSYHIADPFGVVVPEDACIKHDIFTLLKDNPSIEDGTLVKVRITQYPSRASAATGVIEAVLGNADNPRVIIERVITEHGFETSFSENALMQAKEARLDIEGALAAGYRDLRSRRIFTIDPADARDFDDAISYEEIDGYRFIGVHIADVCAYVPFDSYIDLNARRRGTSVYLPDRVLPMLPEELSNELCSLKPDEERLCMSVDMCFDKHAKLIRYDIYPSVIKSSCRFTYEQAQSVLEGSDLSDMDLTHDLRATARLTKQLEDRAKARYALEFDKLETKAVLDEEGYCVDVAIRRKTPATEMIEQAMIAANECVASHLKNHGFPCIYRVHGRPDAQKLEGLIEVFGEFSWFKNIDVGQYRLGEAKPLFEILTLSAKRDEGTLVSAILLKSMKRALYSPENKGHFGLSSDCYCHFTSPIRRYPDLMVHRLLKDQIMGKGKAFDNMELMLQEIAEHSSETEYRAEQASREANEMKIIEYLERYVGKSFSGVISGVSASGIWARLEFGVEGYLRVSDLGEEEFAFDPGRYTLTGRESNKTYRLGKRIAVKIASTDAATHTLNLNLAGK